VECGLKTENFSMESFEIMKGITFIDFEKAQDSVREKYCTILH
jgi:hypothetical protein